MLRCDRCGAEQPADDYLFCVNCGHELDTPTIIRPAVPVQPVKRSSPLPWIVAGVAAVIAAVSITVAVMREPKREVVVQQVPVATPTATIPPTPGPPTASPEVNFPTPKPSVSPTPAEPKTAAAEDDTALCNDGTYTKWQVISKACSANGGVKKWLVHGIQAGKTARAICNDGHMSYFGGPKFLVCATSGGVRHWYKD